MKDFWEYDPGTNCTYTVSPTSYAYSAASNSGTVAVTPSSNTCAWSAASNNDWITITSEASVTGTGTAAYSVAANASGSARTGTMTIGGQAVTIRQAKNSFADDPQSWATPYIYAIYTEGVTTGYSGGTYYGPLDNVTRGQMAAFIIRAKYGETFSHTTTPYYSDVPDTSTFFKYIQKLKDDAITTQTGAYMASSIVSREQMAAFLGRAFLGMQ
jgi:hypothetical protein